MAQTMSSSIRTFNLINKNPMTLDERNCQISSIDLNKTSSSSSPEDSTITSQSCSDDSLTSDSQEIKRINHYIKHSKSNRNDDHITSLKRRVRKQQIRNDQNQLTSLPFPSSTELFSISYTKQSVIPAHFQTKKTSCVVPLPPLITNSKVTRTRVHGIKLNTYTC